MSKEKLAPTVELTATVEGKELHYYMAPGCCGLRSAGSFNKASPKAFIQGMVDSGISGNVMIAVDAYEDGNAARRLKAYVEQHGLGTVTVTPGITNQYTEALLVTAIFEYDPSTLVAHIYGDNWAKPKGWYSKTDKVWMDHVFYRGGGRPKPANMVNWSEYAFATGVSDDKDSEQAA